MADEKNNLPNSGPAKTNSGKGFVPSNLPVKGVAGAAGQPVASENTRSGSAGNSTREDLKPDRSALDFNPFASSSDDAPPRFSSPYNKPDSPSGGSSEAAPARPEDGGSTLATPPKYAPSLPRSSEAKQNYSQKTAKPTTNPAARPSAGTGGSLRPNLYNKPSITDEKTGTDKPVGPQRDETKTPPAPTANKDDGLIKGDGKNRHGDGSDGEDDGLQKSGGPLVLQSSVRTMKDDIAAIRRGQQPAGVKTEKVAEIQPKNVVKKPQTPEESTKLSPQQIELGRLERAQSLEGEKPQSFRLARPGKPEGYTPEDIPRQKPDKQTAPGKPGQDFAVMDGKAAKKTAEERPAPPSSPSLMKRLSGLLSFDKKTASDQIPTERVPGASGMSVPPRKFPVSPKLIVAVLAVMAAFGIGWYVITSEPEIAIVPSPTSTRSPASQTATPAPTGTPRTEDLLTALFGEIGLFILPTTADPLSTLNGFVSSQVLASLGMKAFYVEDENGKRLNFTDFMGKFLSRVPDGVLETLDPDNFIMIVYKPESNGSNEVGFMVGSVDSIKTASNLRVWEGTLSEDFQNILGFSTQNAAALGFLDNIYKGVSIRYRNFPTPADTIDYAVVTMPGGGHYLVIINSRESIYSVIDKLLAAQ